LGCYLLMHLTDIKLESTRLREHQGGVIKARRSPQPSRRRCFPWGISKLWFANVFLIKILSFLAFSIVMIIFGISLDKFLCLINLLCIIWLASAYAIIFTAFPIHSHLTSFNALNLLCICWFLKLIFSSVMSTFTVQYWLNQTYATNNSFATSRSTLISA